jgi:hypothetical protein
MSYCVKTTYSNEASARLYAARFKANRLAGAVDGERRAYLCPKCRQWHISYPARGGRKKSAA